MEDFDRKREQAKRKHQEELLQQEQKKIDLEKIRRANAEACSEGLVKLFVDAIADSPQDHGITPRSATRGTCPGISDIDPLTTTLLRDKIHERYEGRIKVENLQIKSSHPVDKGYKFYPRPVFKMVWRVQEKET